MRRHVFFNVAIFSCGFSIAGCPQTGSVAGGLGSADTSSTAPMLVAGTSMAAGMYNGTSTGKVRCETVATHETRGTDLQAAVSVELTADGHLIADGSEYHSGVVLTLS